MLSNRILAALAFTGFCLGAPLETGTSLEARAAASAVSVENTLLDWQLGYQTIADHVVFLGSDAPAGIGHITVSVYKEIVAGFKPFPAVTGKKEYSRAVQLSICNAETTYALQLLKAHALLRQYATDFSKKQQGQMIAIAKVEQKKVAALAPAFAKYVPLCSESVLHNGRISVETIKDTTLVLQGKNPM